MRAVAGGWRVRDGRCVRRRRFGRYAERYVDGGTAVCGVGVRIAWGRAWQEAGSGPANEVLVLTCTGAGDRRLRPTGSRGPRT